MAIVATAIFVNQQNNIKQMILFPAGIGYGICSNTGIDMPAGTLHG
jgi:hypothetical protein